MRFRFLLSVPITNEVTDPTFFEKTFCGILVLMAFVSSEVKKWTEKCMSLGGVLVMPLASFMFEIFRFLVSVSLVTILKEHFSIFLNLISFETNLSTLIIIDIGSP